MLERLLWILRDWGANNFLSLTRGFVKVADSKKSKESDTVIWFFFSSFHPTLLLWAICGRLDYYSANIPSLPQHPWGRNILFHSSDARLGSETCFWLQGGCSLLATIIWLALVKKILADVAQADTWTVLLQLDLSSFISAVALRKAYHG